MSKIDEKIGRLRETMSNLHRVGGVGATLQQSDYVQHVLNAQSALLEELAEAVKPLESLSRDPAVRGCDPGFYRDVDGNGKIIETKPVAATDESPKGGETAAGTNTAPVEVKGRGKREAAKA